MGACYCGNLFLSNCKNKGWTCMTYQIECIREKVDRLKKSRIPRLLLLFWVPMLIQFGLPPNSRGFVSNFRQSTKGFEHADQRDLDILCERKHDLVEHGVTPDSYRLSEVPNSAALIMLSIELLSWRAYGSTPALRLSVHSETDSPINVSKGAVMLFPDSCGIVTFLVQGSDLSSKFAVSASSSRP
uniref:Uncharacterized protein n=1 Tax=Coccidioides posadasii RMSCC 3488 TaxID=454284 RepID=A0A0J6F7Y6_COCPO|nr:hypothetical protein CPAG_02617 [Coccidioides posadasii RMSCC 3488]